MIEVEVVNEQSEKTICEAEIKLITDVIKEGSMSEKIEQGEVSIILVDNDTIRRLNHDYRGIDKITDVLSFAINEVTEEEIELNFNDFDMDEIPYTLGDIFISIPQTIEQAREYGHSFNRELAFLVIHGFLHLIGYDHQNEEAEEAMLIRQEKVLNKLGITR